jgi:hypothetical protein
LLRNILDGITLDIEKITDYPGGAAELIQQYKNILLFHRQDGIAPVVRIRDRICQPVQVRSRRDGDGTPELIQGRIADNGIYPIEELSFVRPVGVHAAENFHHPVIDGFNGLVIIAEETSAKAKERDIIQLIQLLLARPVVPGASLYDFMQLFQIH